MIKQVEQEPLLWGDDKFVPHERPVKQEPVMDYERLSALREGEQNKAEDDYFNANRKLGIRTLRKMFCQGFERGFHKGLKYAAPVQQTEQEPVAIVKENPFCPEGRSDELTVYLPVGTKLYAAPVRTKDLTDDDLRVCFKATNTSEPLAEGWLGLERFARAVIAADRKLNGVEK